MATVALLTGSVVYDPRTPEAPREGIVLAVVRHPTCHERTLTILWTASGVIEEVEESELGPLED